MAEAKAYKMIPHCTKDTITYEIDELVRCKDCIKVDICCRRKTDNPNWFCADGERKEGR
jgi:hypothetical protein